MASGVAGWSIGRGAIRVSGIVIVIVTVVDQFGTRRSGYPARPPGPRHYVDEVDRAVSTYSHVRPELHQEAASRVADLILGTGSGR